MGRIIFDNAKLHNEDGRIWLCICPTSDSLFEARRFVANKKNGKYVAELKKHYNKRSLNANSYMWVLCDKIGEAIRTTKEQVYIETIKSVGVFITLHVKNEEAESAIKCWQSNGLGWVCEKVQEQNGYTTLHAYKGSSVYTTAEMSRLIDEIVMEAKELGIETATPDELARMKQEWGVITNEK